MGLRGGGGMREYTGNVILSCHCPISLLSPCPLSPSPPLCPAMHRGWGELWDPGVGVLPLPQPTIVPSSYCHPVPCPRPLPTVPCIWPWEGTRPRGGGSCGSVGGWWDGEGTLVMSSCPATVPSHCCHPVPCPQPLPTTLPGRGQRDKPILRSPVSISAWDPTSGNVSPPPSSCAATWGPDVLS